MQGSPSPTSYDVIPYDSQPFAQSHPDRLATLGRLFGLAPAPITQCRVLELGCASGGNLIPMAFQLPESEFVGLDLSTRQVNMGHKVIRELGLSNIRLEQGSILQVDDSWGVFDYIISHGVYSWVPDEIQEKILSISGSNLAPQGIAYVSYNTYPGWHMREMIRYMMRYHADRLASPNERIEQARAVIDFLARSVPIDNNAYGLLLQRELNLIKQSKDAYLFHEHLEEVNTPIYFYQFVERAERHGLQYLAEAEFASMLTSGFSQEVAETLRRISPNLIRTEQYMDFIRNRLFRQTLLCQKNFSLKREVGWEDVIGLLVASAARPATAEINLAPGILQSFRTPQELTLETAFPLTKSALTVLKDHWPRAIAIDALCEEAIERLGNLKDRTVDDIQHSQQVLAKDLLHCYTSNVVELHTWQADFVIDVSERPRISNLAAYLIGQERPVVNQRHEVVNLDPVPKQLAKILDGSRDRAAMLTHLSELVAGGTLAVHRDGQPLTTVEQAQSVLSEAIAQTLTRLASAALLVA